MCFAHLQWVPGVFVFILSTILRLAMFPGDQYLGHLI